MSRHRNIRSMDFSEDYAGYDDVYGHSVEDDYCVSPSDAAFIYDREGSRGQQKISAFFKSNEDIAEEDENDIDKMPANDRRDDSRLAVCLDKVRSVMGEINMTDQELINLIVKHEYNAEKVIDALLTMPCAKQIEKLKINDNRDEKDVSPIIVPQATTNAIEPPKISLASLTASRQKSGNGKFTIPKLFTKQTPNNDEFEPSGSSVTSGINTGKKFNIPQLFPKNSPGSGSKNIENSSSSSQTKNSEQTSHNSLASLASSHLKKEGKFTIPPLFPKPSSDSEADNHNSLASLASTHLKRDAKFAVPKLFPKSSESDPLFVKTDTSTFSTLADLTKNHLHINRIGSHSFSIDDSKFENDSDLVYSTSAPNASLHEPESKVEVEGNDWLIDLSQALISSSSSSLVEKPRVVESEEFSLQFIDCDQAPAKEPEAQLCRIDITPIIFENFRLEKPSSPFGKVLSNRYKARNLHYNKMQIIKNSLNCLKSDTSIKSIPKFRFNTPSPDEQILFFLRRK